jgi:hypothetical protein
MRRRRLPVERCCSIDRQVAPLRFQSDDGRQTLRHIDDNVARLIAMFTTRRLASLRSFRRNVIAVAVAAAAAAVAAAAAAAAA